MPVIPSLWLRPPKLFLDITKCPQQGESPSAENPWYRGESGGLAVGVKQFESRLFHWLPEKLWASFFASLHLGFLIWKKRKMITQASQHCWHHYHVCLVTQSCPTLCNPLGYSPPGSSVLIILQARILEWAAVSFSRGSSWPRGWTQVSYVAGIFFTT